MSLLSKVKNWKVLNELWDVIQPFVLKLVDKKRTEVCYQVI